MTEEELLQHCKAEKTKSAIFWPAEVYGFGRIIREFGFYPNSWPLYIYLSHGLTMHETPAPHELDNAAPVMFYFSPRLVEQFNKVSSKWCFCLISPNVFYRRAKKITGDKTAKGTLAFLAHTTAMIE